MKAMVLAAGVGSRLDPLTSQLPKPLVPVANAPVMEHILKLLRTHGFNDVIANLHYLPEQIEGYFRDGAALDMRLSYVHEPELTGDAGGVRTCCSFFGDETFLVVMGDLLTDADLTFVVSEHKRKKALATIAVKQVEDVSQFGVVLRDKEGFITGFQEKPRTEEALSNYASTGIYVLEPEVFRHIPRTGTFGFGRQLFPLLVERGLPVLGVTIDRHYWSDVGTIAQYRQSNFDAVAGRIKVTLPDCVEGKVFKGAGAEVSPQARVHGRLLLGGRSRLGADVEIRGTVVIGDDCRIEPSTILENCVVWSGTVVESGSRLLGCVVGANCVVAPGSVCQEIAAVSWPPAALSR